MKQGLREIVVESCGDRSTSAPVECARCSGDSDGVLESDAVPRAQCFG